MATKAVIAYSTSSNDRKDTGTQAVCIEHLTVADSPKYADSAYGSTANDTAPGRMERLGLL